MIQLETYVIHAKTMGSTMSVATEDPVEALRRAKEMANPKCSVTITDRAGNPHTIAELEAIVGSEAYAKPASSER